MKNFKKVQLIALALLAIVALFIGIKNIIFPALDLNDLKVALSALVIFFFNFGFNLNLILREKCKIPYIWQIGCILNIVAMVLWLVMIWFNVEGFNELYTKICSATTLLALTVSNITCTAIVPRTSIFTPITTFFTYITCLLLSGFGGYFIIFAPNSEYIIRTILVLFLLLCYCNTMLAIIHFHEKNRLKPKDNLILHKTSTENVYADNLGNLYIIKPTNLENKYSADSYHTNTKPNPSNVQGVR